MSQRVIRTILVPTDFSECAASALGWARTLAKAFGAKIALLHVVDLAYVWVASGPAAIPAPVPDDVAERIMEVAKESLKALAPKGTEITRRLIRKGHPREVIIEVAKEVHADAIVMGTHGRRGVSYLFMGSVAEHVVRHSPVPVWTTHGLEDATEQPRPKPGRHD